VGIFEGEGVFEVTSTMIFGAELRVEANQGCLRGYLTMEIGSVFGRIRADFGTH
jgi:hypothetical protein